VFLLGEYNALNVFSAYSTAWQLGNFGEQCWLVPNVFSHIASARGCSSASADLAQLSLRINSAADAEIELSNNIANGKSNIAIGRF
jgi:hypothetical protein